MDLLLIRHGATEWNATGRFVGRTDIPLSETGVQQAKALAEMLKGEPLSRILTSDLQRARATAQALARGRDTIIELDARLREFDFGLWEGLTWLEIIERFPELTADHAHTARLYAPSQGETFDQVCSRVAPLIDELLAVSSAGDNIALVSHAGVIHAVLSVTLGLQFDTMSVSIKTGSVTRLTMKNGTWQLMDLSDVPTLDPTH